MGLTKQYLRFVPGQIFGIISSSAANILFVEFQGKKKSFAAVPACENVIIWNYRTGECAHVFRGDKHTVTCFISDNVRNSLAIGYADGTVRVFSLNTGDLMVTFSGHKSPVTCLAYDDQSHQLASGSKDTEVVLWDVVGECGLFRLVGHKGPITNCQFLGRQNILITSSEDKWLKFWHLDSQRCFKTVVSNGEIWDFVVLQSHRIIAITDESDVRVWDVNFSEPDQESGTDLDSSPTSEIDLLELETLKIPDKKNTSIRVVADSTIMGCHGYSKFLHLYKFLNQEESLKKLRKRIKKERKRLEEMNIPGKENTDNTKLSLSDEIITLKPIQTDAKIVHFDAMLEKSVFAKVAVLLNNNSFSVYGVNLATKDSEAILLHNMESGGHRSSVNTASFSSNGFMMLSGSSDSVKVWNNQSQACTHTFECDPVFCSLFATGDNHCIVGTKSGQLKVFELSSHLLIETVEAHESAINDLAASPDKCGLVTCSNDKDAKFWNYELVKDENYSETKKRLGLVHTRTLKMAEEILCVKFSSNQKFIALSLLDCTVKVLFCDTLKLAFSLYGHKLPVSCMDISYDSSILASGSKDKNVKLWSLEFGHCLKSMFAHNDSITCLQFIPNTHMIFTAGKDKLLKQWDCDNFRKIVTLDGHQSKISALAISPDGKTVLTASLDRSLRLWDKTSEPLVLEEEEEMEREEMMDKQLLGNKPVIAGEENKEVGLATKTTIESLKTAEQLIEALEIFKAEVASLEEHKQQCLAARKVLPSPIPNPMLTAYSTSCPYQYMLKILRKSRSSTLEGTLLHLPFNYVSEFLKVLAEFVKRKWELELTTRCVLFLVRIHLCQITQCKDLLPVVEQLKSSLLDGLTELKDTVGCNTYGLKFLQKEIESREEVCMFADASQKAKRRSRKRALVKFV